MDQNHGVAKPGGSAKKGRKRGLGARKVRLSKQSNLEHPPGHIGRKSFIKVFYTNFLKSPSFQPFVEVYKL